MRIQPTIDNSPINHIIIDSHIAFNRFPVISFQILEGKLRFSAARIHGIVEAPYPINGGGSSSYRGRWIRFTPFVIVNPAFSAGDIVGDLEEKLGG